MIVIVHDHVGMKQPSALVTGFKQGLLERGTRGTLEEGFSVVAATDDVIDRPGKFQTRLAGHGRIKTETARGVEMYFIGLTPSAFPSAFRCIL
jgi:hypothetical protein